MYQNRSLDVPEKDSPKMQKVEEDTQRTVDHCHVYHVSPWDICEPRFCLRIRGCHDQYFHAENIRCFTLPGQTSRKEISKY